MTRPPTKLAGRTPLGPFFAVEFDPVGPGWVSLRDLVADSQTLEARVLRARQVLARSDRVDVDAIELRVVASVEFVALAARVISPALAMVVFGAEAVRITPDTLLIRETGSGFDVGWPGFESSPTSNRVVGDFAETVLDGLCSPLVEAFRGQFRLSPLVLWGNVFSALCGAAGVISAAYPDNADAAWDLVERTLRTAPLAGCGQLLDTRRPRRRSCCLFYRVPGRPLCGDCVLLAAPRLR